MIVDFHAHIFPPEMQARRSELAERDSWFASLYGNPKRRLASAEDVVASMSLAGVDRTVVCGFGWRDGGMCREHNNYLVDSVASYPDKLIGLAAIQPLDARDAQELQRCLDAGLMGMGELNPDGQRFDVEDAAILRASVDVLLHYDRPLLTHSSEPLGHQYPGKGKTFPWKLLTLARNFPALKIVMAHWGGGLPFYALMPEVGTALANVYYDSAASTFLYDQRVFSIVSQLVGSDHILWGSDYPLLSQQKLLARVRSTGLTQVEQELVLGGNAAKLLRLQP